MSACDFIRCIAFREFHMQLNLAGALENPPTRTVPGNFVNNPHPASLPARSCTPHSRPGARTTSRARIPPAEPRFNLASGPCGDLLDHLSTLRRLWDTQNTLGVLLLEH